MIPTSSDVKQSLSALAKLNPIGRKSRQAENDEARALQTSLLPTKAPAFPGYDLACAWHPSSEVSGDYFDIFPLDDNRMALCVADVSGKGLQAAVIMSQLQEAVRTCAPQSATPAELCSAVNRLLSGAIPQGSYITMFYAILDRTNGRLQYENAGHSLPLLIRGNGAVEFPASFSGVLGLFSHWLYQNQELNLGSGDVLLLVTDGVIEAQGRRHEEFGYQRLISLVQKGQTLPAESLNQQILEAVAKFSQGNHDDDASLVVVRAQ